MPQTTISSLKVGTRLFLGAYDPMDGPHFFGPQRVVWLKASPENDFITEQVIDMIQCAASNVTRGEVLDYEGTMACYMLNSRDENWVDYYPADLRFVPTSYRNRKGFLYMFDDHEVESIDGGVRLPYVSEIVGDNRLKLFNRKGIRAVRSSAMRGGYYMYEAYWLADTHEWGSYYLSRSATVLRTGQRSVCGLRPMCRLKDLPVEEVENGIFRIIPYDTSVKQQIATDDELYALFNA